MKPYTRLELQESGDQVIPFPYIEHAVVSGMHILIYMDNFRSEDWYGYKGWYRRIKDHRRATEASENTHKRVLDILKRGDTVFDCGANEGFMSVLYAAKVGPTGKVVAFEPEPKNCEIIRKNAEINGLNNIVIVQKALSDIVGTTSFAAEMVQSPDRAGITVEMDMLDNYAHMPCDFIKIDVEGYELPVIRGAHKILDKGPAIELEMHLSKTTGIHMRTRYGFNPDDIYRILWDHGYELNWPDGKPIHLGDEPGGCVYGLRKKENSNGNV